LQMPVNPLGGEPPTGEPDAGDPHVRFGGGRGRELNRPFLPLSTWFVVEDTVIMIMPWIWVGITIKLSRRILR